MLTDNQARALWEAGGFALLQGLPEGSETGIDGRFHTIKAFAGHKFVPPGFHMVVWSASPSGLGEDERGEEAIEEIATPGAASAAAAGAVSDLAGAFPLRVGYIHYFSPRERVGIRYDQTLEEPCIVPVDESSLVALDPKLAAYPFAGLERWKGLSSAISPKVVEKVLGDLVFVDSLTGEEGGDEIGALREAVAAAKSKTEGLAEDGKAHPQLQFKLQFPVFDLKRSANEGATGDQLSKWSRDKSVLLAKVCGQVGGLKALLGHLQLAFLLITNLWNFAALGAYKRMLALLCRSSAALATPEDPEIALPVAEVQDTLLTVLSTLTAQLSSFPDNAFDTELPDMDAFFIGEIEQLRRGIGAALAAPKWWSRANALAVAWRDLQKEGAKRGWEIESIPAGDEDSDEEGEYAPVVVET